MPTEPNRTLDAPPPQPAQKATKKPDRSLMELQPMGDPSMGLGAEGGNPLVIAQQAYGNAKKEFETLAAVLPGLAPALMGIITQLGQVLPQAMAEQVTGGSGAGAGAPMGGMAPGAMPPGPPPMGGPPAGPMGP
ncbi:MAG TPA: hypothetical protein VFC19_22425 [Candidatus Limnocylindrales bacterium]|nr:hypothetical protein [Candidatus Limnocylindrales bacterium]